MVHWRGHLGKSKSNFLIAKLLQLILQVHKYLNGVKERNIFLDTIYDKKWCSKLDIDTEILKCTSANKTVLK